MFTYLLDVLFSLTIFRKTQCLIFGVLLYIGVGMLCPNEVLIRLTALMIAILAPVLSLVLFFPKQKESLSTWENLRLTGISLIKILLFCFSSALFIVVLHMKVRFMFGVSQFYGVKLSIFLPMIMMIKPMLSTLLITKDPVNMLALDQ